MMVYQNSHSIKEILSRVVILDYYRVCCQICPLYIYIYIYIYRINELNLIYGLYQLSR